jgi:hypothetical protein
MLKNSLFFPGFNRRLFGRPPVSELDKIARQRGAIDRLCLAQLCELFGAFLPAHLLEFRKEKGANSRRRVFTPAVTMWRFLGQVLDPGSSCRKAVANLQALFAGRGMKMPSGESTAYCQARSRLPVRMLRRVLEHVTDMLSASGSKSGRTLVVDGTAVTMPDTPENQRKYPQHGPQKPGCGFPIMKIVGLFCLESGAWIACAKSHFKVHESRLFRRLFHYLRRGDTIVTDRGFCSFWAIADLGARGVDIVMRNHQRRKSDFRTGVRLGKDEHLVTWEKPQRAKWMSKKLYAAMPEQLVLRETRLKAERKGFRTQTIIVVSSFLDTEQKSREELAKLFLYRWRVELYFDDIKTTMGMDVLRTKSPELICRELLMHMIAYNLIRALALRSGIDPNRASFKGIVDRVNVWSWVLWAAPTRKKASSLAVALFETIADDPVTERPGRREPRAVKRRPKPHQYLTKHRKEMIEIPHRSKYRKAA